MTPDQVELRDKRRSNMTPEGRQLEAIESIADSLEAIRISLGSMNSHVASAVRKIR